MNPLRQLQNDLRELKEQHALEREQHILELEELKSRIPKRATKVAAGESIEVETLHILHDIQKTVTAMYQEKPVFGIAGNMLQQDRIEENVEEMQLREKGRGRIPTPWGPISFKIGVIIAIVFNGVVALLEWQGFIG